MLVIYLIALFSFIIASSSFIKKKLLTSCSYDELIFLEYIFLTIPIIIYIAYMYMSNKNLNFIKKIELKTIVYLLITTSLAICSASLYYYLIKKFPISKITPILNPLIIIFTILIGFILFNETISKQELFGISIIIAGIFVTTYTSG